MFSFLKRRKKSSEGSLSKGRSIDPFQRQLETFQSVQQENQEKKRHPFQTISISQIENEINAELKNFPSHVRQIKEISLKIEELTKLLRSGEIPENAYKLIMEEMRDQLSFSVEEIYRSREVLELARAKAKLEWAREKVGLKESEIKENEINLNRNPELRRHLYASLNKWEEITSKIDSVLSSLSMEEEASIIEQYLSIIKEKFSQQTKSEETERCITMCQQRLNLISEKWSAIRRSYIEQIMNLEIKASQIREQIEELKVRFGVGEIDQGVYEYRMGTFQGALKEVEKEILDIRNKIDEMDMKIFRSSELLR